MVVRILTIENVFAPDEQSAQSGKYRVVLEADGEFKEFIYRVEFFNGGRSVSWEPAQSFLSDVERTPIMVVATITDTVIHFHQGELIEFPIIVEPLLVGSDTTVIRL